MMPPVKKCIMCIQGEHVLYSSKSKESETGYTLTKKLRKLKKFVCTTFSCVLKQMFLCGSDKRKLKRSLKWIIQRQGEVLGELKGGFICDYKYVTIDEVDGIKVRSVETKGNGFVF
ncbi:unnamed protein product [Cochlearia groenlandica]